MGVTFIAVEVTMAGPETTRGWVERRAPSAGTLRLSVSGPEAAPYHLVTVAAGRHAFLGSVFAAFDAVAIQVWTEADVTAATFDRGCTGGITTAIATCDGRPVGIVWSDFRVNGAAYGRATSSRLTAFLRHLRAHGDDVPLIYVVNSAGVSIMEGRTAFSTAFGIWPELLRYAESHLVLTCAVGKCLGLAPLLYGLGHYRVAVGERTRLNLTGPDVMRMFFGRDAADFESRASAERCVERHDLVHEIVPSVEVAFALFRALLAPQPAPPSWTRDPDIGPRTRALLGHFLDHPPRELVPGWCPRVRLFIGTRRGRAVGIFVNPLERADNLIRVRTLDKYAAGLDLFRALRLPILSVLDSPGVDPRFDQGDSGSVRRILSVGEKIIDYPYGSMAVVAGRCYGGATTLAFPKVFGGRRAIAVRGAQIGVMDDRIVGHILSASARLLAQWRGTVAARGPEFEDLLAEGSLDAVIDPVDLPGEVDRFLDECGERPGRPLRLVPRAELGVATARTGDRLEVVR